MKENLQQRNAASFPRRADWKFQLIPEKEAVIRELLLPKRFPKDCCRPCTKVLTLLPRTEIDVGTGVGYHMINVDGYRTINAYVISDALNSTLQRGFTLELSFALNDFVPGQGVKGETSYFFNMDSWFDPGTYSHRTNHIQTDDLTTTGGLPWIGGVDLTHILRVPVLGPYVRASVFNEDSVRRGAEVKAYLST